MKPGRCCCRCGLAIPTETKFGGVVELHRHRDASGRLVVRKGVLCANCLAATPSAQRVRVAAFDVLLGGVLE